MSGPKSASREPSLGLADPAELAERLEREQRAPRAPGAGVAALLARLAELATMRATIAQEEAQNLADLARIADIHLAGSPAQSVTSTVQHQPPVSAPSAPAFLDQQGIATLLACHPRTVRRMELEGELPASVLVGGLKRWRRQDLDTWLEREHATGRNSR